MTRDRLGPPELWAPFTVLLRPRHLRPLRAGAEEGPAPNLFQLLVQIREEEAKKEEEEAEAALLQLGLEGHF